jgi:hypothetical protein
MQEKIPRSHKVVWDGEASPALGTSERQMFIAALSALMGARLAGHELSADMWLK